MCVQPRSTKQDEVAEMADKYNSLIPIREAICLLVRESRVSCRKG